MSEQNKNNELDEQELEQVAGGKAVLASEQAKGRKSKRSDGGKGDGSVTPIDALVVINDLN